MARKNTLSPQLISTSQSLAANFNSPVTLIPYLDNISYQINASTTNSQGTFSVQGSNDYSYDPVAQKLINAGNWADLDLAGGVPFVNAANDTILIALQQVPFQALRIHYNSSVAGTGTCNIYVTARQVGG